ITVNETPVSPVITGPDSICSGNNATLTATAPGGTYNWYETATGGTPVFTGSVFITPILTGTKTYYVEVVAKGACVSVSRTAVTVVVNETPVSPVVTGPDTICSRNTATLTATAPGGIYKWYETATGGTPVYVGAIYTTPALTTTKTYYVESISTIGACASTSRTPVTVTVLVVKAEFTANPLSGEAPLFVDFTNKSSGANSYHWELGDQSESTSVNTSHTYNVTSEGTASYEITLISKNAFGCADTSKLTITVFPFSELIVPNVFTPNGDGINDLFNFESSGLNIVNASLFDRWGLKLYEWSSLRGGWDGRSESGLEAPEGTYYYLIIAKGYSGKEYKLTGHFTLLR
ncbi:MAG TPA: gliding motility-associated C-terminal domain-containing protein, partial [Bacteroidia bacterium]|nr:gliding motility-associated C-terminal domain-containing protein [Bacteroidia bacterium]